MLGGSIKINEKMISKVLFFEILYVIFYNALIDFFKVPSSISMGIDVINILVLGYLIYLPSRLKRIYKFGLKYIYFSMIFIFLVCLYTAAVNTVKPQLVIWSVRNTLRFYPFFLGICLFWDEKMIAKFTDLILYLQIPNFLLSLYQFFVLDCKGDNLGGVFGISNGCNGFLNIYLCILVTLIVQRFISRKTTFLSFFLIIISAVLIGSFAELKVIFIEIPIIIGLAVILQRPSKRTALIIVFSGLSLIIGVNLILFYFPQWTKTFSSIDSLIGAGNYVDSTGYRISRINAFNEISQLFFRKSISLNLFGYGFGNCEYSKISIFMSSFAKKYGYLNYRWFSHQMWFLQCGIVGIVALFLFFSVCFFSIAKKKRLFKDEFGYGTFGQIMIVILLINFFYNNILISEIGYLSFASIALPFAYYTAKKKRIMQYNNMMIIQQSDEEK